MGSTVSMSYHSVFAESCKETLSDRDPELVGVDNAHEIVPVALAFCSLTQSVSILVSSKQTAAGQVLRRLNGSFSVVRLTF